MCICAFPPSGSGHTYSAIHRGHSMYIPSIFLHDIYQCTYIMIEVMHI